jgi:hypothetical protein
LQLGYGGGLAGNAALVTVVVFMTMIMAAAAAASGVVMAVIVATVTRVIMTPAQRSCENETKGNHYIKKEMLHNNENGSHHCFALWSTLIIKKTAAPP